MTQPSDAQSARRIGGQRASSREEGAPGDRRQDNGSERQGREKDTPVWEWIVAYMGLALVAGTFGFMCYQAIKGDSSPPDISVQVDSIQPVRNGYLVKIRAFNRGGSTAAGLTVEGELRDESGSVETSDATINYVPSHSERRGGLFFTKDPRQFQLQLRAEGYEAP